MNNKKYSGFLEKLQNYIDKKNKYYPNSFYNYNLSQEEIDSIIKEIKEEQNQLQFKYDPPTFIGFDPAYKNPESIIKYIPTPSEPNGNVCNHKMVPYTGLFETYNHCEKCGQKEK